MSWFLVVIGIASFIGLGYSIEKADGTAVIAVLSTLGMLISVVGIYRDLSLEPITYDYPANEYILEYKVVTVGEKCDTTYVLTKIKTD